MGVASYNRGTQVIRRQIDEDVKRIRDREHPAESMLYWAEERNETLSRRVASLEADLDKAKRYLAIARAERDAARAELAEAKEKCSNLLDWGQRMRRQWVKASRLLRMLPAEMVAEARSTGEHRTTG